MAEGEIFVKDSWTELELFHGKSVDLERKSILITDKPALALSLSLMRSP